LSQLGFSGDNITYATDSYIEILNYINIEMHNCFFVSDLHGNVERYEKLSELIIKENPKAVFMGGDLLPHSYPNKNFTKDYLIPYFASVKKQLKEGNPRVFIILGNDDARLEEQNIITGEKENVWEYIHFKLAEFDDKKIFGYSFIPPSPFLLKDWEKYDVSRYVEPGCISPEEGKRTVGITEQEKKYSNIKDDLDELIDNENIENSIFLFHGPPYQTNLDRAALDGVVHDHVQADLHVGSIAIKRFIEQKQPLITLHGHIHESARLMGTWKDKIGKTFCFSAAHDGKELAVVIFDTNKPEDASRILI
jgi:uncharacterized protein